MTRYKNQCSKCSKEFVTILFGMQLCPKCRKRKCLRCDQVFRSHAVGNRICGDCNRRNAEVFLPHTGVVHSDHASTPEPESISGY